MDRRHQQSVLDEHATLVDYDWQFNPKRPRQACFELHTLKFITEAQNALLIANRASLKARSPRRWPIRPTRRGTSCATSRPKPCLPTKPRQAPSCSSATSKHGLRLNSRSSTICFLHGASATRQGTAASPDPPALQAAAQYRAHFQPAGPGLGQASERQHHGRPDPRAPEAPRALV